MGAPNLLQHQISYWCTNQMSPWSGLGALSGCVNMAQLQGRSRCKLGCGTEQMENGVSLNSPTRSAAAHLLHPSVLLLPFSTHCKKIWAESPILLNLQLMFIPMERWHKIWPFLCICLLHHSGCEIRKTPWSVECWISDPIWCSCFLCDVSASKFHPLSGLKGMYLPSRIWENKADGLSLRDRCPHQKTVTALDTFPAVLAKILQKRKNIPFHFAYIYIHLHAFRHLLSRMLSLPIF